MLGPWRRRAPFAELLAGFPSVEVPWTTNYASVHADFLVTVFKTGGILARFAHGRDLPAGFGASLDERVVEYPWALTRCAPGRTLDAGSTLNHSHVLDAFLPRVGQLSIVTLTPEDISFPERGVEYQYADLRDLPFPDSSFDMVVSISTLEHIGMDNRSYGADVGAAADPARETELAVRELMRVLKPEGRMLLTVPYGRREDHRWFRQLDEDDLEALRSWFQPARIEVTVFAYSASGWQRSSLNAARQAHYRDYTQDPSPVEDRAAAARAVACLDIQRTPARLGSRGLRLRRPKGHPQG